MAGGLRWLLSQNGGACDGGGTLDQKAQPPKRGWDWYRWSDSNRHSFRGKRILSPSRLPFRHTGQNAQSSAARGTLQAAKTMGYLAVSGMRRPAPKALGLTLKAKGSWRRLNSVRRRRPRMRDRAATA